ncbi:OmpA family protein [Flavobacterium sp. GCM10023249]|uniref:OmpA family protein n=1 Tax=unclassified Flavobacterium TaxID=196869 RepID=UPI003609BA1F
MRKIYFNISLLLAVSAGIAQNKDTKSADKLFNSYEYINASKEYLKLEDKGKADSYVYKQLGDCYYNIFNAEAAEKWYAKAIAAKEQDAETYFRYAQMLKANKKYDEAKNAMDKFGALAPNDERAKASNATSISALQKDSKNWEMKSVGINSKYSDFGAYLKGDKVYFASARNTSRKTYEWNDQPFLDLYEVDFKEGTLGQSPIEVAGLNTSFHEGPVAISADGNTIYFSRESFSEKQFVKSSDKKNRFGKMYLFKATKDNGKWTNVTALPFNGKEFNSSSPSLSADGTVLYFTSDRPGGIGKTDIWKVAVNADGTFGTPENLGKRINTEGNEQFPSVTDSNILYFASNGFNGLGGLDVFEVDLNGTEQPKNLGAPVNSEKDDFAFAYNESKKTAFLSSNRNGGTGDDDIYMVLPICHLDLVALVRDSKTGLAIPNANIIVLDENKNTVMSGTSNENGDADFQLDCEKKYEVSVGRAGYLTQTFPVSETKGKVKVAANLNPVEVVITEKEVILGDVYFAYNKSNITPQGAAELDKLVAVMNEYPNMVIFAKSHTDSRGNDKYNLSLSERRAKATVQYIISKGITADRISGQGYGETEPKVNCGDGCTEEEYAQNRRSEFMIVKK